MTTARRQGAIPGPFWVRYDEDGRAKAIDRDVTAAGHTMPSVILVLDTEADARNAAFVLRIVDSLNYAELAATAILAADPQSTR